MKWPSATATIAAVIAPIITAWINNRHNARMKKMESPSPDRMVYFSSLREHYSDLCDLKCCNCVEKEGLKPNKNSHDMALFEDEFKGVVNCIRGLTLLSVPKQQRNFKRFLKYFTKDCDKCKKRFTKVLEDRL